MWLVISLAITSLICRFIINETTSSPASVNSEFICWDLESSKFTFRHMKSIMTMSIFLTVTLNVMILKSKYTLNDCSDLWLVSILRVISLHSCRRLPRSLILVIILSSSGLPRTAKNLYLQPTINRKRFSSFGNTSVNLGIFEGCPDLFHPKFRFLEVSSRLTILMRFTFNLYLRFLKLYVLFAEDYKSTNLTQTCVWPQFV